METLLYCVADTKIKPDFQALSKKLSFDLSTGQLLEVLSNKSNTQDVVLTLI